MRTYENFNRDQFTVLGIQLSMVSGQLARLEESLDGDAQVTLDYGEFNGACATLIKVLEKANVRLIKKAAAEARVQPIKPSSAQSQPKKNSFVCYSPNCRGKKHYARGLCHACYVNLRKKVANGELSWEQLESEGMSKPAKYPPKNNKVTIPATSTEDTSPSPLNQAV